MMNPPSMSEPDPESMARAVVGFTMVFDLVSVSEPDPEYMVRTGFRIKPLVFQFASASMLVTPSLFFKIFERQHIKNNGWSTRLSENIVKQFVLQHF